jgi:hypothetical protein
MWHISEIITGADDIFQLHFKLWVESVQKYFDMWLKEYFYLSKTVWHMVEM